VLCCVTKSRRRSSPPACGSRAAPAHRGTPARGVFLAKAPPASVSDLIRSLEQRAIAERALERRRDALGRELAIAAQEVDDGCSVGVAEPHVERIGNSWIEINLANLFHLSDSRADRVRHGLDRSVLPHQLQRLLRPDAFDALVEIVSDEDAPI